MSLSFQHSFFQETAKKYPDFIAVRYGNKKFTYKELDQYSNKIANLFNNISINQSNERIVFLLDKTIHLYASILGILKAGACWVPLNENFPNDRIKHLVKSLKPKVIVTQKKFLKKFNFYKNLSENKIICIDQKKNNENIIGYREILKQKNKIFFTNNNLTPSDLAYIIFTSGSTGSPKGVMVTHQNTSTFLNEMSNLFLTNNKLCYAHFSEITFDPSIFDLFVCWKNAGTLIPFDKKEYKINPILFFKNQKIDVILCTPSLLSLMLKSGNLKDKSLKNIKHLLLTGEKIDLKILKEWKKNNKHVNMYNLYGTTETAIISHWYKFPKLIKIEKNKTPVGKKLRFLKIILKDNKRINSYFVNKGESYVCGPQISPGYWNNEYLTSKYFIDLNFNNFSQKYYKTGDILEKVKENYFYIGREDDQIKIRGHRVELSEIENTVLNYSNISDAIAVTIGDNFKKFIVLFFKTLNKKKFNILKLKNYLKKKLPNYMLPKSIIRIKKILLNDNGKIDKIKLIQEYYERQ